MRFGRYRVYYDGYLVKKVWSLDNVYKLIANMIACGYDKEKFSIEHTDIGFDL